ncbi:MAG: DUF481 domain-containing protein [Gammaproteobacteria bacterium]
MHKPGRGSWGYFFLVLAAGSTRVIAAEYYIEPAVTARYEFDNNRTLDDPAQSASTWRFSPFAAFGRLTPNSEVTGAARVEVNESNREELDSTDVYAGLFPVYRTERSEWSLDTTYRRDTTLRTNIFERAFFREPPAGAEILPPNPEDVQREDPDLGLRRQETRRNVVLVSPEWRRELSPRLDLGLRYTYVDTFYGDDGVSQGLVDSRRHLGRGSLSYRYSEVDDVSVFTAFQNFKNDENREFDTYRIGLGLKHRFSETLVATLNVGPEYTDESDGKDDFGYSVGFGVNKKLERSQLAAAFRRGVAPNERGDALDRNQVDIRWFGDLSERWSFSLLARAFQNESASGTGSASDDRYYAQVEPRIIYRITEDLSCDLGYRFRWEDDNSPGGQSATAHAGLFSVIYAFDRFSLSR